MSVQITTDAVRSLLAEALRWALPRLGGYILAAVGSVLAFTIWAVIYTYVWPGKPPPVTPPAEAAARIKPLSQVPSDVLPSLRNMDIYDPSDAKVGRIKDVLIGHDGNVVAFIVSVSGGFLGEQGKDIAAPFQAMQFKKKDGSTWVPVLNMTKSAVQGAPKQRFDASKKEWTPDLAPAR